MNFYELKYIVKHIIFLFWVACCVFSCTYQLDEIYFEEIDNSNVSIPSVDFFASEDTLYIRNSLRLSIPINHPEELANLEVSVGNESLNSYENSNTAYINIDPKDFETGIHTLTLIVETHSRTGSLGDILNLEKIRTTYQKHIIIDNNPIVNLVKGFEVIDGILHLTWQPYTDYSFEEIEISGNHVTHTLIDNPQIDKIAIPEYYGGRTTLKFTLKAKNETLTERVSFFDSLQLSIEYEDEYLKLNMPPVVYENYDGLILELSNEFNDSISYIELDEISFEDYIIPVSNYFPVDMKAKISTKNSYIFSSSHISTSHFTREVQNSFFNNTMYFINDNTVIEYGFDDPDRYVEIRDKNSNELLKRIEGKVALSQDGKLLYQITDNLLIQYNPLNGNTMGAIEYNNLVTLAASPRHIYASTDGYLLIYNSYPPSSSPSTTWWNQVHLLNIEDRELVYSTDVGYNIISHTGTLLYNSGHLSSKGSFFAHGINGNSESSKLVFFDQPNKNDFLGTKTSLLLSEDAYISIDDKSISKVRYKTNEIVLSDTFSSQLLNLFSNGMDKCAVILETGINTYDLVVLSTVDFSVIQRRSLNPSLLEAHMKFCSNTLLIAYENTNYYWNIEE
ncbi:hypothetical protein [Reichenbachiella ulvae]|uniref:Uncharacterized protein n=1 Tax=Reichenbachiella ulvae TaxID=2980104 RepID=A0ABT3CVR8_9BACT|nr:hypothetical protein [Reichenbachiella ulvae]MCV9387682.1 hypothetical protein [Reichenbachiella ulvae]